MTLTKLGTTAQSNWGNNLAINEKIVEEQITLENEPAAIENAHAIHAAHA